MMATAQKITLNISVRFRDIDSMGHVNNAVFFTYFEEGRKAFIHELFGLERPSDFQFILAHVSCDYLRPVKLNDKPTLQTWISSIGTKRFDMQYELLDSNDETVVYARGQSIQVFYDYQANQSKPIPDDIRKRFSLYT
ncbi:MAG: acyl-CoA thioesterase [Desulfohalobiaceae bacterium]|nr:acyl-CoA thioesterase [Desulfohalobiaceae bacterium]